jgi:hypothetical protein
MSGDDRVLAITSSREYRGCNKSGWVRYLTPGETDGGELPRVILPRVCQPLRRNDYYHLNKYPSWMPPERNGAQGSK